MKLYILTIALLPLIVHIKNAQYVSLTEDDKEYLLKQLPKNHKLSIPMQQFFNQSHFQLPDERSKRQFMMYQPEAYAPAPPPAYQLNLPIIRQSNAPSYMLVAPPMVQHPDYAYVPQYPAGPPNPQWPKDIWTGLHMDATSSTSNIVDWEEFANNAVAEASNLKKGIRMPVDPQILASYNAYKEALAITTTLPHPQNVVQEVVQKIMAGITSDPPSKSTQIMLRQVEIVLAAKPTPPTSMSSPTALSSLAATSSPATAHTSPETSSDAQLQNPKVSFHLSPQLATRNNPEPAPSDLNPSSKSDVSGLLAPNKLVDLPSYNKAECDQLMKGKSGDSAEGAMAGPNFSPVAGPNISPVAGPNISPMAGPNSSPMAGPNSPIPPPTTTSTSTSAPNVTQMDTQKDAEIKEKLMNILKTVEAIKPKEVAVMEGLPCSILGKWISTLAGSGFRIDQTDGINFNVPLIPAKTDGFLKGEGWQVTASVPLREGGLFILTATRSSDNNMATFTGECRTCNTEQIITGHWLVVKPALTCEEMNRGQDFFGDTWKRDETPLDAANPCITASVSVTNPTTVTTVKP